MLYQLLNSGTSQCRAERWYMIRVLRMCARSAESIDLAPLRKRHVPSMLMATFDSVSSGTCACATFPTHAASLFCTSAPDVPRRSQRSHARFSVAATRPAHAPSTPLLLPPPPPLPPPPLPFTPDQGMTVPHIGRCVHQGRHSGGLARARLFAERGRLSRGACGRARVAAPPARFSRHLAAFYANLRRQQAAAHFLGPRLFA